MPSVSAGPERLCADRARPGGRLHTTPEPPHRPPLVGRSAQLDALAGWRAATAAGSANLVALVGEPGIGKTALADACIAAALAEGFVVARGEGWPEGGAPRMWPWQHVLVELGVPPASTQPDDDRGAAGLGAREMFALFRSVADTLDRHVARPALIVIDDVHLTDPSAIQLARFLVRSSPRRPLMVLLAAVEVAAGVPAHVTEVLTDVVRDAHRVEVGGLTATELGELVAGTRHRRWAGDLDGLARLTGGNPLLAHEVLRAWDRSLDDRPPEALRRLAGRRLTPFDHSGRLVLATVALLGGETSAADIAAVAGCSLGHTIRVVEAAHAHGTLRHAEGRRHAFVHGVVRDALVADLGEDAVAQLRERAAELWERRAGPAGVGHLVRIAELRLAVARWRGASAWSDALAAVRRAARADLDGQGYLDALALLRSAQQALGSAGRRVPAWLLVDLGRAEFASGRVHEARAAFRAAADGSSDDPELFAEAVAGLGGLTVFEHRTAAEVRWFRQALDRAIESLGDTRPDLCLRLEARRAAERWFSGIGTIDEVRDVVDGGREWADARTRAETLSLEHHVCLGPEHADLRARVADELIELSSQTGDGGLALMGPMWRAVDLVLAGDHAAVRALHDLRQHADALRVHSVLYVVELIDAMLAVRAGRFDDAERSAAAAFQRGIELGEADAAGYYGATVMVVRWLQRRSAEILDVARRLVGEPTILVGDEVYAASFAAIAADAGGAHVDEARHVLDRLRASGLDRIPSSSNWLVTMACVVEAAHRAGDAATAAAAYPLLLPFAELPIVGSLGSLCLGPVTRALALAASTTGRVDDAIGHFEQALAAASRIGNRPLAAVIRGELGAELLRRGSPTDRVPALAHLQAASESLRVLDLHVRAAELEALLRGAPAPSERLPAPGFELRRVGRRWVVSGHGERAELRDSAGLDYLARLLADPGVDVAAADLAGAAVAASNHDVLDQRTRLAYRRRAEQLTADLEAADRAGDAAQSARAQAELDELLEQLRSQTRLDGRSRAFVDDGERARTAVQKAIRRNIDRISAQAPRAGAALTSCIRTGTFCRYEPGDDSPPWAVHRGR